MNKKSLTHLDRFIETYEVPKASEQKSSIIDLFRFRGVCRNQLLLNACWLSFSMGYFGLTYNTPPTDLNPFLVFSLPGIVGAVMGYAAPFMENRLGRKTMLTFAVLSTGVLLLLTIALPEGSRGITILCLLGTLTAGLGFGAGYSFTKEIMPTVVRTNALSFASSFARIGSMLSPIIAMLEVYSPVSKDW